MHYIIRSVIICCYLFAALPSKSQPNNYDVYAIRFASSGNRWSLADWVSKGPGKDSVDINFMVWLIKGKDGRNILLDAGFLPDIEDAKEFNVVRYVRPDTALQKLALKPTDITDIIVSHPHWDHIDGIDLFPNAKVWMQKLDYEYCISTAWQKGGDRGGLAKRDMRKLLELSLAGKLMLVDGDNKEIIPGIHVFTGSRHTFNSQYVQVVTGNSKIILASDNIWVYYQLEHMRPPSTGGTMDTTGYVKAMQRMKSLVSDQKLILPGHDAKVFTLFPKISDGIVQINKQLQ